MTALIDAAARDRIRKDLNSNLCVEAGAGTGKTTVLVDRIVALLQTGRATVDDLAVITFTEKAAGELATRVRFELEKALAESDDPGARGRLEQALTDLYRARIQTIHAFAADLLRERPVEARLDPQFEVLDDLGAELGFDESYRRWLDVVLGSSHAEVECALRRGFELRHLRELVEAVHRHREVLPLAPWEFDRPDVAGFRRQALGWREELERLGPDCVEDDDLAYRTLEDLLPFLRDVERADDAEVERLALVEAPWPNLNVGRKSSWSPGQSCTDVKACFREYRDTLDAFRAALRTEAITDLLPLVADFVADYTETRREEGAADFDDLLIWARDLVRDDERVRAYFHRRSPRILVDEFQDTDPVQAELISWICAPAEASGRWEEVTPVPGSLFVVADPKQSIYRFRGADVAIYDAVKHGTLAGELEYLQQNFRSSEELLGWVNAVFDRVFVAEEGIQPPNTPLVGRVSMAGELGRSPVVVVQSTSTPGTADERRTEEASLLARTLARAVREEGWVVRDRRQDDAVRSAQWRDIAVLVPSRTGIEVLEAALQRYDVPYRLEAGRGFFSRQEVRDLVSLLHAIDDPTDSISIVAALRSLAFGCSDEDLLLWQLEHRRFDYRYFDRDEGPVAVREAMELLADLKRARGLSLGELVRIAVGRTGMVEAALSLPSGAQAAANVLKLVDQARAFSAAGGGALRAFTGWLARMRDREADEIDAPVAEERDDVVRVMTIHAAKGLEFPIVALGNLESTGRTGTAPVRDAAAGRVHLVLGPKGAFATPGWEEVKQREQAAIDAERQRLLYVAATRARDHLVVPVCTAPEKAKGFLAWLTPSLPGADADRVGADVDGCWLYDTDVLERVTAVPATVERPAEDSELARAEEQRERWAAERDGVLKVARSGIEILTASSLKVEARPLAAEAATTGGDSGSVIDVGDAPPLELGDAFHRVMQLVSLPDGRDLEQLASAACAEAGIPDAADAVVEMARRCLNSQVLRDAIESPLLHREVPFVLQDVDKIVGGRIDLLFGKGDGVTVLDYKTDDVPASSVADAAERHRAQIELYRAGVAASGASVDDALLLFARTGFIVRIGADEGVG